LTDADELRIDYRAKTDQQTIINLTNHSFFNLNGQGSGDILKHTLYLNADSYTPMDADSIPLGQIVPVENTPFDFRQPTAIGTRIDAGDAQLKNGNGYDHNFVLRKKEHALTHAATATGDASGIKLDVFTTEPGLQLYTGNFMDGSNSIKGGFRDAHRTAFCLETQHFPDAPNLAAFPSIALYPGDTYNSTSVYRFSIAP
jgi:aldose 1-epimerase